MRTIFHAKSIKKLHNRTFAFIKDAMPLVSNIPALDSASLIGHAGGSAQTQIESRIGVIVVEDAPTGGTATVVERLAVRDARVRLARMERPDNSLHRAMVRHIRPVELAWGRFRFAPAIKRRSLVAAFFRVPECPAHIGRARVCAVPQGLIQGKRRKHA